MISEGDLPIPNPTFFITETSLVNESEGLDSPKPTVSYQQMIETYVTESIKRALENVSSGGTQTAGSTPGTSSRSRKSRNTTGTNSTAMGEMSGLAQKKSRTNRFTSLSVPKSPTKKFGKQHSMQIVEHVAPVAEPIPEFDPIKDSEGGSATLEAPSFRHGGSVVGGLDVVSNQSTGNMNKQRMTGLMHADNFDDKTSPRLPPEEDPKLTVNQLPTYFLGGVEIAGFGKILGHALALLYVARHGLKESELWSIIASLPRNHLSNIASVDETLTHTQPPSSSKHKQPITDEMRALISVCAHYREKFRATWQSNDLLHTNRLTIKKLLLGMKLVNAEFTEHDLNLLLMILDCPPQRVSTASHLPSEDLLSSFLYLSWLLQRMLRLWIMSSYSRESSELRESSRWRIFERRQRIAPHVQVTLQFHSDSSSPLVVSLVSSSHS
jgi:hypothetical protein